VISRVYAVAVLPLLVLGTASPARGQLPSDRVAVGLGFGLAASHVSIRSTTRDTAYQGSVQFATRADVGLSLNAHVVVGLGVAYSAAWGVSDCIPGFTVCAPGVSFGGLTGFIAWRPVPKLIIVSGGVGPYRLSRTYDDKRATTVALTGALETWLLSLSRSTGLSLGLHGTLVPDVPGPPITSVALLLGLRSWL
jgi:hypothetical protein